MCLYLAVFVWRHTAVCLYGGFVFGCGSGVETHSMRLYGMGGDIEWDGMGEYRKGDRSFGGSPFFVFGIVCLRLL